MNRLTGSFYFILTENGNLIGEFFNDRHNNVSTESAVRMNDTNNFEGSFFSSWIENNNSINAFLNISQIVNTNLFELIWRNENENVVFQGKGQIINNILVGYYTN